MAAREPAGTVYVRVASGRALRRGDADVLGSDVVGIGGRFAAGDVVNVVTRGSDGGQGLLGTAIAQAASPVLEAVLAAGDDPLQGKPALVVLVAGEFQARW